MASDSQVPTNVFSISTILDGRLPPGGRLVAAAFDAVSGLASLQQSYRDISRVAGAQFLDHAVTRLGIGCDVTPEDLSRIPQSGPTVIVANHPFGGAEGLVLARVLLTVRPDVRVMGNRFLSLIPELRGLFIPVDPFGGSAAASRSIGGLRRAVEFLEGGGLLAVFPAGEVASLDLRRGTVDDPPWSATVVRLARRSGAAIVPVFFPGRNGATFQLAGLVHPMLRTALLPRQLLKQSGRSLTLAIGKPVLPASSAEAMSDEELIGALRGRTRLLAYRGPQRAFSPPRRFRQRIADPLPAATLRAEIESLPPEATLVEGGGFRVLLARAAEIPSLLLEIGQRREASFRAAGEGTGRARDLDRFDPEYLHLCLWDSEARAVAGAYRIGQTDVALQRHGMAGLYTNTLFRFGSEGVARIHPALELGRSFIHPDYQRSHSALLLLWQGIGAFVVRNPRYRYLFGPVSISQEYGRVSRELMVRYLGAAADDGVLLPSARPRRPFPMRPPRGLDLKAVARSIGDLDDLSAAVADLEGGRGIPVLVRQYLRLGGRIACFNVDRDFADVVDALVVVDLAATQRKLLDRYLGCDGSERFLAFHRSAQRSTDASQPRTGFPAPLRPELSLGPA